MNDPANDSASKVIPIPCLRVHVSPIPISGATKITAVMKADCHKLVVIPRCACAAPWPDITARCVTTSSVATLAASLMIGSVSLVYQSLCWSRRSRPFAVITTVAIPFTRFRSDEPTICRHLPNGKFRAGCPPSVHNFVISPLSSDYPLQEINDESVKYRGNYSILCTSGCCRRRALDGLADSFRIIDQ